MIGLFSNDERTSHMCCELVARKSAIVRTFSFK